MAKQLPKAILFDADGTLYDSEALQYEATRQTAQDLHGFDFSYELYESNMLRGSKSGHEILLEQGYPSDDDTYQQHKQLIFEIMVREKLTPLPGIEAFLAWCDQQSIRRVIVSSARRMQLEACLSAVGIRDYFKIIIAMEDTGEARKPQPFPYTEGLRLAGVASDEAIAVEDTAKGITSARAAGLHCIGIRNPTNNDQELAKATAVIKTYDELRRYLLE